MQTIFDYVASASPEDLLNNPMVILMYERYGRNFNSLMSLRYNYILSEIILTFFFRDTVDVGGVFRSVMTDFFARCPNDDRYQNLFSNTDGRILLTTRSKSPALRDSVEILGRIISWSIIHEGPLGMLDPVIFDHLFQHTQLDDLMAVAQEHEPKVHDIAKTLLDNISTPEYKPLEESSLVSWMEDNEMQVWIPFM